MAKRRWSYDWVVLKKSSNSRTRVIFYQSKIATVTNIQSKAESKTRNWSIINTIAKKSPPLSLKSARLIVHATSLGGICVNRYVAGQLLVIKNGTSCCLPMQFPQMDSRSTVLMRISTRHQSFRTRCSLVCVFVIRDKERNRGRKREGDSKRKGEKRLERDKERENEWEKRKRFARDWTQDFWHFILLLHIQEDKPKYFKIGRKHEKILSAQYLINVKI